MKVITFYTSELYRLNALELLKSAEAVGLKAIAYERPDLGTWWQNCNQKCDVVLEALREFGDEPLIWCDADARLMKYPTLLDEIDADVAAFFYSPVTPIGGMLWWNGRRALRYVEAWAEAVRANPEEDDDKYNLGGALHKIATPRIFHLPPSYCWNERAMRSAYPGVRDVVMVHGYVGKHDYPSYNGVPISLTMNHDKQA